MNTISNETYVFPERLKEIRELRKLTQAQLAENLKFLLPQFHIWNLGQGNLHLII